MFFDDEPMDAGISDGGSTNPTPTDDDTNGEENTGETM